MLKSKIRVEHTTCESEGELFKILEDKPLSDIYKYSQGIEGNQCSYSHIDATGYNVVLTPSFKDILDMETGRYFYAARKEFLNVQFWEKKSPISWPGGTIGEAVKETVEKTGKYNSVVLNRMKFGDSKSEKETSVLSVEKERIRDSHVKVYWSDGTFGRSQARSSRREANSQYRLFEVYSVTEGKITEGPNAGLKILSLDTTTKPITYDSHKVEYFVTAPDVSVDRGMAISQFGGDRIRGR